MGKRRERDEQVKGKRPRTSIHTHRHVHPLREPEQIEGQRGVRKEDTARRRDLLLGIYCYYPKGEDLSTTGNSDASGVGCVYPICAVRARTHIFVRVYTEIYTDTRRIVGTSRHPCIPSPSDLRFVVLPLHTCITLRV